MNMFVCLSTSQTNEHWPLIGRTNEYDLTNTVRLFIGHPVSNVLEGSCVFSCCDLSKQKRGRTCKSNAKADTLEPKATTSFTTSTEFDEDEPPFV
jgi:hypothetical protein